MDQGRINEALKKAFSEDLSVKIIRKHTHLYKEIYADIMHTASCISSLDLLGEEFSLTAQAVTDIYKHFGRLDRTIHLLDSLVKHGMFHVEDEEKEE